MTPAIIAHYLVAIAVIAVFLTIALIREALIREAADRRRDEEFDRMRAADRAAARRRTDALYLDFARRARLRFPLLDFRVARRPTAEKLPDIYRW